MDTLKINEEYSDATLNISFDTLRINKQALIFVNTKRSAESLAEKIAIKVKDVKLEAIAKEIREALSRPTKQCERLAKCVEKGIAFHHSGLASAQREIVEDNFRNGNIKIICSTPTLAMGIDMPAFRTIIKDLKRYGGHWGMEWIQVLEYHQMAGRAGRPGKEDYGEAICIAGSESERDNIVQNFINGDPENIYSKLAVEPVLRTYVLSLISTGFVKNKKELVDFFSRTFWAHQYKDTQKLVMLLNKVIKLLEEWEFLTKEGDFRQASIDEPLEATLLGKRVAELYIDPLTADFMINCMRRGVKKEAKEFSYMHMVASTLEMRPAFRARVKEILIVESKIAENEQTIINPPPSLYEPEYEEYLSTIKTAIVFEEWCNELDEHDLLEKYDVRPGEFRTKLEEADWLLNSAAEFARLIGLLDLIKDIRKTQVRMKYGAKEELIPLLKLRNVGRIRARMLYKNGIKDLGDLGKADLMKLVQLLGPALAKDVKSQIGQETEEVKTGKRKGQKSVDDY